MLALIKIKDAYDYDSFHPNSKNTYRVITNLNRNNGEHLLYASSPLPLSNYLKKNFNIIDKSTSVYFSHEEVTANNKKLSAKEGYVDPDFYKIFGFRLKSGAPAVNPQTVVLTERTAERFFGKDNPIGQTITIGQSLNFVVTGILAAPQYSSHLKFDLLASTASLPLLHPGREQNEWTDEAAAYTYVQIKTGVHKQALGNALISATIRINKMLPPSSGKSFEFNVQPLNKISPGTKPMHNTTDEPIFPNLIAFALIGFFMLLLAFFNYVNLTLARSLDRAREIGIRKVAGALKFDIMLQFLSESLVVAILAFCIAYLQLKMISSLPTVQSLIGTASQDATLWLYFVLFTLATGLIAGWIPSKVFSSFQPVKVLKGKFNAKLFGGIGLRKTLTVIQFAASLIAIVTMVIFYRQSVYMATADYGFQREKILNIALPDQQYQIAATALSSTAGIEEISGTSGLFGFSSGDTKFIKTERSADSIIASCFSVTPTFVTNMNLTIVAGQNLPVSAPEKSIPYALMNEEAARILHYKDPSDAIGKSLWVNDSTNYVIAGVVKDFHYASFLRSIQPMLLVNEPGKLRYLNLKVSDGGTPTIISSLNGAWKKIYPHQPFDAQWYDRQLYDQHLHKDDLVFIGMLTSMALLIACLGLLGMVIYTTRNRAKEVGIRRVMGAKVSQVMLVISKEFITLLLIAVCIGLPAGFVTGSKFLQQYAYRISVGFGLMAGCAISLVLIGGITIGWQVYRVAISNPVKSLRTE